MRRVFTRISAGAAVAGFAIGLATAPASALTWSTKSNTPVGGSVSTDGGKLTLSGAVNVNKSITLPVSKRTVPININKSGSLTLPGFGFPPAS